MKDPIISEKMLGDIEFIHKQLKEMGNGFDKRITAQYVGQTIDFIKGVLWQMKRQKNLVNPPRLDV